MCIGVTSYFKAYARFTYDQRLQHLCLMTLGFQVRLLIKILALVYTNDTWHSYAQEYLPLSILKCEHMTLGISMLKNIFKL